MIIDAARVDTLGPPIQPPKTRIETMKKYEKKAHGDPIKTTKHIPSRVPRRTRTSLLIISSIDFCGIRLSTTKI